MEYLRGRATASAPALYVVCRYLAQRPEGYALASLRAALQPIGMASGERDEPAAGNVLDASVQVGMDLRLLVEHKKEDQGTVIAVDAAHHEGIGSMGPAHSLPFRALLLRLCGARAVQACEAGEVPGDLFVGLTWLLQQDPLEPFTEAWDGGAEDAARQAGLVSVASPEQWRAMLRWGRSLGLLKMAVRQGRRAAVIPDPSVAISIGRSSLPKSSSARQWFNELKKVYPMLGSRTLLDQLPSSGGAWSEVPPSVALAIKKLERSGQLKLTATDDSQDSVTLRLGDLTQRVGRVEVIGETRA